MVRRNASLFLDRAVEQRGSEAPALLTDDGDVSYGELLSRCGQFAAALSEHGVRREDRVLVTLDDSPLFAVAFLGAIRLGAIPVAVNPYHNVRHFSFFLDDIRPRVVVVGDEARTKVADALRGRVDPPMVFDGDRDEIPPGGPELERVAETYPDDPCFMLYSSGTTGMPRGVVHLQHDVAAAADCYPRHVLRMSADDVTCASAKLSHAYGLANNLLAPLCFAATTVIVPGRATPESIVDRVRRFRPTLLFAIPTHYLSMLRAGLQTSDSLASLRHCVSAGERLAPEIWSQWRSTTGLEILDAIGSTELLQMYCSNRPDDVRPGSTGKPVPGCTLRVIGEHGLEAPIGQVGELHVRSDAALAYYWQDPETTTQRCRGEWFATGDHFHQDDDGFYWYDGRIDDMYKIGGLWVSPSEVEDILHRHPAVGRAAVVGVEEDHHMIVKAYVVAAGEVDDEAALALELQRICKEHLERHRYPRVIEFVEALPTASNGKIQRFKLRDRTMARKKSNR